MSKANRIPLGARSFTFKLLFLIVFLNSEISFSASILGGAPTNWSTYNNNQTNYK